MGNPNLGLALDFILADNTPLFVDKCVTQTHGGSHLKRFKNASNSPVKLQEYFPAVKERLLSWEKMFLRDGVHTVGGVYSEVCDEQYLLERLYEDMSVYVDWISDSIVKSKRDVRIQRRALQKFVQLKELHMRGVGVTGEKIYVPDSKLDGLYRAIREEVISVWKNSVLYRPAKDNKKPSYADQKLVAATMFLSHQKTKSALLTADFGIRKYYDYLYVHRPDVWRDSIDAPIELLCFRSEKKGMDKDILEMTTYLPDNLIRNRLPVDEMQEKIEQRNNLVYQRTG